ncbi:hypothetical protein VNO80_04938 [Phaseolus coccineus]|uniref:Uncharacterized protein n=1 Tax=Phaseolus coccineus TaxID=3886 RepID=A0AAN9NYQ0_PHACN
MLVSLEALAMAGASDVMDIEEWEQRDLEQYPPPHLLAQEEEKEDKEEGKNRVRRLKKGHVYGLPTTHLLRNHKEEEHAVTFTNIQEKLDRTVETMCSQCTWSMKIIRTLQTLFMIIGSCIMQ